MNASEEALTDNAKESEIPGPEVKRCPGEIRDHVGDGSPFQDDPVDPGSRGEAGFQPGQGIKEVEERLEGVYPLFRGGGRVGGFSVEFHQQVGQGE